MEKVTEYIGLGVEQGGKILIGGNRLEGEIFDDGFYVEPTIFVDVDKENIVVYHCTQYRDKKSETGIKWNDKTINIKWPVKKPKISDKDSKNISFKNFINL